MNTLLRIFILLLLPIWAIGQTDDTSVSIDPATPKAGIPFTVKASVWHPNGCLKAISITSISVSTDGYLDLRISREISTGPCTQATVVVSASKTITINRPGSYKVRINGEVYLQAVHNDWAWVLEPFVFTVEGANPQGPGRPPICLGGPNGLYNDFANDFPDQGGNGLVAWCNSRYSTNDRWRLWNSSVNDAPVYWGIETGIFANIGTGVDVLYNLGGKTTGVYEVDIETNDRNVAFNFQYSYNAPGNWAFEVFLTENNTGSIRVNQNTIKNFSFQPIVGQGYGTFSRVPMKFIVDLNRDLVTMSINGVSIHSWRYSAGSSNITKGLGAINFWGSDTYNYALIDACVSEQSTGGPSLQPCERATALQCDVPVSGSTVGESNNFTSTDYRSCYDDYSFNGNDKLYKFTLPRSTKVNLRLSRLSEDIDMFLLSSCNPASCIAYSINGSTNAEIISANLSAGTYYVVVDGYRAGEESSFLLHLECETAQTETCPQAIPITCGRTVSGNTMNGTAQFTINSYQNCYASRSSFNARELVYKVQVNSTSILDLQLYGHSRDLDMFLLTACQPTPRCVASSTNGYNYNERIRVQVSPGTYYIVIDGYNSTEEGAFNLSVNCGNYVEGVAFEELSATPGDKPSLNELTGYKSKNQVGTTRVNLHNTPNPFNQQTAIVFDLPESMKIDLQIFDTQGRKVHHDQGEFSKGLNRWDFLTPSTMVPGLYYYRIQGEGVIESKSMIISH
ncbi:pre-peptidase C-terminal domain-containing protein [Haliscomenobacter sp.]|uniref:pre-peptidase C-terminal domain-containing protein n=1 Tax=Haliscomenobacter sp. TaxID=2717303 RepID=UPI003593442E